jgi:hypothetical protein
VLGVPQHRRVIGVYENLREVAFLLRGWHHLAATRGDGAA